MHFSDLSALLGFKNGRLFFLETKLTTYSQLIEIIWKFNHQYQLKLFISNRLNIP